MEKNLSTLNTRDPNHNMEGNTASGFNQNTT